MKTMPPKQPNLQKINRNQNLILKNINGKFFSGLNQEIGSSMIELLIAAVVALFAASAAAQIMTNLHNSGVNRRTAVGTPIDVAISNDLAWFQQYAVLWRMQKGPYKNLPIQITKTDIPYSQIQNTTEPNQYVTKAQFECDPINITNMAIAFQLDASNSATYTAPINTPPNPIPAGASSQSISLPAAASEYTLSRQILPGSVLGTLKIVYTLKKLEALQFVKTSSVYLPASGWCS